ncbi:SSI family serine proteinase inhibitor [Streptomyces sp. NPDC049627]|uniref:SSI family serine proteinase inhibitor n=1 Tax=Streptomyces sp. NPDC049627 TaxID=3365595 RepID=UPI00379DD12E
MLQVDRSASAGRLRRLFFVAAGSLAAVGSTSVAPASAYAEAPYASPDAAAYAPQTPYDARAPRASPAGSVPLKTPPRHDPGRFGDHLTITVRDAGGGDDGTRELYCHPSGGDHPDAADACAALDRGARWGKDAFAAVPEGGFCTMQYGGPATAHVTGTWAGRPVDARFDRSDGCEIGRWDRLVPVLPDLRPEGRS